MANNMSFTPFPEDAYRLNIAVSKSDLSIDQFFKALYSIHPINCLRCYKTKTYYTVEVYQSTFTVQHNLLCTKCSQTDRLVGYGEIRELRTWVLENYIQYTYCMNSGCKDIQCVGTTVQRTPCTIVPPYYIDIPHDELYSGELDKLAIISQDTISIRFTYCCPKCSNK